jgi:5,6,7,8-tetrahydromethanopterin hydro-lyase
VDLLFLAHMDHEVSEAEFLHDVDGKFGEGWGGEGVTGIHVNLVIGRVGSPTSAAATTALANPSPGHVPFLVCAGAGTLVRPATVFINKTTLDFTTLEKATWGAAQLGIARAILDAVAAEQFPALALDDLVLLAAVWLDPALTDVNLSPEVETTICMSARSAMSAAITDALNPTNPDAIAALVGRRATMTNAFYTGQALS